MSRRTADPQPGLEAKYSTFCARCGEFIDRGERIVHHRGDYIHVGCASGQDEGK